MTTRALRPGPLNGLCDVAGLRVGQAAHPSLPTGVTVILADALAPAGVHIAGGGPATRETDALAPDRLMGRLHGVTLSGGSVYGLAAADGVVRALGRAGVGVGFSPDAAPAPIVPAAAIYDLAALGREPPDYAALGAEAAALAAHGAVAQGAVGAGRGARAGDRPGGVGAASIVLASGATVAALMVVNPAGSTRTPCGRAFWAWPFEVDGEFGGERPDLAAPPASDPTPADSKLARARQFRENTTIGVVATDAALDSAACSRVAQMATAGLARAVRPAFTPYDGDAIFAIATGARPVEDAEGAYAVAVIGAAAADCVARAVAKAVFYASFRRE